MSARLSRVTFLQERSLRLTIGDALASPILLSREHGSPGNRIEAAVDRRRARRKLCRGNCVRWMSAVAAAKVLMSFFLSGMVSVDCEFCRRSCAGVRRMSQLTTAEGQFCNNLQTPGSRALKTKSAQVGRISRDFGVIRTAKNRPLPRFTAHYRLD